MSKAKLLFVLKLICKLFKTNYYKEFWQEVCIQGWPTPTFESWPTEKLKTCCIFHILNYDIEYLQSKTKFSFSHFLH